MKTKRKTNGAKPNPQRRFAEARWLDALAESWDRTAKNKTCGEAYSQALRDCAFELRLKTLQAESESASSS